MGGDAEGDEASNTAASQAQDAASLPGSITVRRPLTIDVTNPNGSKVSRGINLIRKSSMFKINPIPESDKPATSANDELVPTGGGMSSIQPILVGTTI